MKLTTYLFLAILALISSGATHASGFPIVGFGSSTTGGAGAEVREVRTKDELRLALCSTEQGGRCTDTTPRTIKVVGTIDFINSEGTATVKGCYATGICAAPHKSEVTLLLHPSFTHCEGKKTFDVSYDAAGTKPLLVGSNKTLIGVGSDAGIKGKGLMLDMVENIIIRNLSFTDINQGLVFGGDAIRLNTSKRVVIDHNYFARIARAMISSGHSTGVPVDMVTISWNRFDGSNVYSPSCNGMHYWNLLLQGDGNVTFANNWLHDFSGRGPKIIGNAFYHAYNNYFQRGAGHAFDISTYSGNSVPHVLMEGNHFADVVTPSVFHAGTKSGRIYAISGNIPKDQVLAASQRRTSYLGRGCAFNMTNSEQEGFVRDTRALDKAKTLRSNLPRPLSPSVVPDLVTKGAGVGKI